MINFLKVLGLSLCLILVLSITIKRRTLFSYVYGVISPMTTTVQSATEQFLASSYKTTQDYTKRIFHNSLPRIQDTVKNNLSAPVRSSVEPEEDITASEKQDLDSLIRKQR